ncbi:MAG: tryptophan--tRNA ligase [Bacillota bacterium]|nr:tryptophan--tRNA ligase [Bacillota bacterium]MDD3298265.1 tryptophan--tRNA ligase [Bacillota bacterium]MDD3851388.1 tryptophan--tRNA ligase [Bacillota bacterium]MDD4707816.1 tryptophan--tRNA ligase [Bacillota bacterium]
MAKDIIMSGMRPTGKLHLGNYFGALENWVKLQNEYNSFHAIVDWHALTTAYEDTSDLQQNIMDVALDWLSAGLDPDKCTIYVQSEVKEISELFLLLSMITPLSWLERCPTYKDQLKQLEGKNIANYGFLGYPCLMATDILVFKAGYVPVGEDQIPHLELSREIARRFNHIYGDTFPEPEALLTEAKVLPGLDGRKMSKSYENAIYLSDTPEEIQKKVGTMITDPQRIRKDDPGDPGVCSAYALHKVFTKLTELEDTAEKCRGGAIGCVACKRNLAKNLIDFLEPIRAKREELVARPDTVRDILSEGARKAREAAARTLEEARKKMNLNPRSE